MKHDQPAGVRQNGREGQPGGEILDERLEGGCPQGERAAVVRVAYIGDLSGGRQRLRQFHGNRRDYRHSVVRTTRLGRGMRCCCSSVTRRPQRMAKRAPRTSTHSGSLLQSVSPPLAFFTAGPYFPA